MMPLVGLGLWKIEREKVAHVVRQALEIGYRHLDSAADYGNEVEVGQGIKQALADGVCSTRCIWSVVKPSILMMCSRFSKMRSSRTLKLVPSELRQIRGSSSSALASCSANGDEMPAT